MSKLLEKEIRVRLNAKLPLDPLQIVTMADYDMSLLLTATWFEYDKEKNIKSTLISSWSFDLNKGAYQIDVSDHAKWSDGSKITLYDLLANLKRSVYLKTSYGEAISGLVKIDDIKILSENSFLLPTIDGKPQDIFFRRMGSSFLAIVNPKDWDADFRMVTNKFSAGPYKIETQSDQEIILFPNEYFPNPNPATAKVIKIKKPNPSSDLNEFLNQSSWENITQVCTMLDSAEYELLRSQQLPFWTREHDRTSLLKPMPGTRIEERKSFLRRMWQWKQELKSNHYALNVKPVNCLQPVGFPLYEEINLAKSNPSEISQEKPFKIVAGESISTRFHMKMLNPLFEKHGFKVDWHVIQRSQLVNSFNDGDNYDFVLFDFGVADPEPLTHTALIVEKDFVHADEETRQRYKEIGLITDNDLQIRELKKFLKDLAEDGCYLPLFGFSTLSIGHKGISFEKIVPEDETVDYSKVVIR